ncbi:MAG: hypothetical protein JRI97_10935 [Deltaproteobacteria bacterium]|nr:hypothetical protein [Deltaproteobacteria bacterium]
MKERNRAVPAVVAVLALMLLLTWLLLQRATLLGVLLLPLDVYLAGFLLIRLVAPLVVRKKLMDHLARSGGREDFNRLLESLVPSANTEPEQAEASVAVVVSILREMEEKGLIRVQDNIVYKVH